MVEFRKKGSEPPVLIEVNGRFWHSLPLACYAGADFPALLAGMIFTFTRSVTTLSAVIFVVSPHWSLVTPTILSQMDRGDVGEAAALSVILVVLVLAVIHGVPRLLGGDWRAQQA